MKRLLWLPLLLICLRLTPAIAQPAPGTPATAPPVDARLDVRRALEVLKDERRRADLIATLEAIAAVQALARPGATAPGTPLVGPPVPPPAASGAQPPVQTTAQTPALSPAQSLIQGMIPGLNLGTGTGAEPAETPPKGPLAVPLAPDSLGANLLLGITELTNHAAERLRDSSLLTIGLPRLVNWTWDLFAEPAMRQQVLNAGWRMALAFAGGFCAMWLTRRLLRGPRARLLARAPSSPAQAAADQEVANLARAEEGETEASSAKPQDRQLGRRLQFTLGRLGLDLLAPVAFLAGAHLVTATPVGGTLLLQLMVLAPMHAFALWQAVLCICAALTAPDAPALRVMPASDATAIYMYRQLRWLTGLLILGDAAARVGWLLGMSAAAHVVVERTILAIAHIGVAFIVLHQRRAVADWLRTVEGAPEAEAAPLLARLAPAWHWLALACLLGLWVLLLLEDVGGPIQVLALLLGSAGVLVVARVANNAAGRMLDQLDAQADGAEERERSPYGLHAWLRMAARLAIGIATVLVLLQVWGLPALPWLFSTELGRQILGGLGTIGVTIGCAVVVWELTNLTIKRHLSRLQAQAKAARAARLRTFLPMLRMILMVGILIMVGLTVLSQIGVNIAPLLAGAGVVGIAIGLGSQKLVQDVITGLFLLLENVMQVGDVVSLGGMTGVVEELSIRSIRLRADDGSIHVIPFSAVTTVTNMTRDFGQAVIEARIAITEDYDRVVALLRETFEEMRTEPLWATDITGDLDMQGLARLDDTAMVLKCRIRCGPFARWRVLREYQRRMQQKFAAAGIMLPMAPPVAPPVVPPVASPVVPRV